MFVDSVVGQVHADVILGRERPPWFRLLPSSTLSLALYCLLITHPSPGQLISRPSPPTNCPGSSWGKGQARLLQEGPHSTHHPPDALLPARGQGSRVTMKPSLSTWFLRGTSALMRGGCHPARPPGLPAGALPGCCGWAPRRA